MRNEIKICHMKQFIIARSENKNQETFINLKYFYMKKKLYFPRIFNGLLIYFCYKEYSMKMFHNFGSSLLKTSFLTVKSCLLKNLKFKLLHKMPYAPQYTFSVYLKCYIPISTLSQYSRNVMPLSILSQYIRNVIPICILSQYT